MFRFSSNERLKKIGGGSETRWGSKPPASVCNSVLLKEFRTKVNRKGRAVSVRYWWTRNGTDKKQQHKREIHLAYCLLKCAEELYSVRRLLA
jgi:hypothetical protein